MFSGQIVVTQYFKNIANRLPCIGYVTCYQFPFCFIYFAVHTISIKIDVCPFDIIYNQEKLLLYYNSFFCDRQPVFSILFLVISVLNNTLA